MVFTALSCARMSRRSRSPVRYTYATPSEHRRLPGRMVAAAGLPVPAHADYLVIGLYLNAALPALPAWVIVVVSIGIVTALNIVGVVSVAQANFSSSRQAIAIVVFGIALAVARDHRLRKVDLWRPSPVTAAAWRLQPMSWPARPSCALAFLGFDAVSTLSGGARRSAHPSPWAGDHSPAVVSGIIFILLWRVAAGVPVNNFAAVDTGSTDVMVAAGGAFVNTFLHRGVRGRCARVGADLRERHRWPASCSRWAATASCRAGVRPACRPSSVPVCDPHRPRHRCSRSGSTWRSWRRSSVSVRWWPVLGGEPVGDQTLLHRHAGAQRAAFNLIAPAIGPAHRVAVDEPVSGTALTIRLIWLQWDSCGCWSSPAGSRRPTPVLDLECR